MQYMQAALFYVIDRPNHCDIQSTIEEAMHVGQERLRYKRRPAVRNLEKDEIEMAAKRERMLATGFQMFAEKSIEPVTMQDVATACGLGVATLYRYFSTKLIFVIASHG